MATTSKKVKYSARQRSKLKIRKRIMGTDAKPRVSVFRSAKHTYAQVISDLNGQTLVSASTLEKEVIDQLPQVKPAESAKENAAKSCKSVLAAKAVGIVLAKRCQDRKIDSVVFDRNGFVYKGRIKAVAEGAREGGLKF